MDLGFLKTFRRLLVLAILMGVFFVSLTSGTRPAHASTGTNQTINFQGRLLTSSGAAVPDGYYNIQFKIYQDGDGASVGDTTGSPTGTLKWTENYLNVNSQGVRVFNGYMSVSLGSVNPFGSSVDWNQNTLWLSMNIGNTNVSCASFAVCSPDGEMTPMQPLTSAVYALNSNQLGGLTAAAFGQLAASQTFVGANIFQPTTNVTGVKVIQSSAGAPTADIFNVQSANNTNLIQVTGPAANSAAITLRSIGTGNAITLNSAGALSFTGAAASVWDIGNNTLSLQTTNNGAITTGSGLLTVGGSQTFSGANPVISTSTTNTNMTIQTNGTGTLTLNTTGAGTVNVGTTNTTTVGIGNNTSGTVDTITGGATAVTVANGGTTVKTSTNSATAFQVQNASNAAALSVDTTSQRVGINNSAPGAALEVTGDIYLTKEAARVIKVDASTTASTAGGSLTLAGGTGNAAVGGAVNINGGTAINSVGGGGGVNIIAGNAASGSVNAGGSVVINSGVGVTAGAITLQTANFSSTFGATNINTGGGKVLIGSANNGVQIDTGQNIKTNGTNITANALATPVISTGSTGSSFYYGVTAVNGQGETILSNTVGMASSSATISWAVVPGATSYKVYRNSSNVFTSGSLFRASTANGLTLSYTDDGTATTAGLPPTSVTGTKLTVQGWASQTANLQEWQNSAGSALAVVDISGNITAARFRSDVWQDTNNNSWASITGTSPSRTLAFGNASISTISITPKSGGDIQLAGATKVNSTGTAGTVEKFRVNTPTTVDNSAASILATGATTSKGLVIQGAASQTANLQEWQTSAGANMVSITAAGALQGGNASGTDVAGTTLTIAGGQGTGTGNGGNILFRYAAPGTTGASNNALVTACTISGTNGSFSCTGAGASSERFGAGSTAAGTSSVAVGNTAGASGNNSIGIGAGSSASSTNSISIGASSIALNGGGAGNIAIGSSATAGCLFSCPGSVRDMITLGSSSTTQGDYGITIGNSASNTGFNGSIVIGTGASNTAANQLVIGSSTSSITNAYLGNGVVNAAPTAFTLNASGGSGTNIAGANLAIAAGKGTGNAASGNILFQTSTAGATGATLQSLATVAQITGSTLEVGSTGTAGAVEKFRVNTPTTSDALANTILSADAATSKALVIQGAASQTANSLEIQSSTGADLFHYGQFGLTVTSAGGSITAGTTNAYGAKLSVNTVANGNIGIAVRAAGVGQTANLQEWQSSTGTVLASVDASGNIAGGTINTNTLGASALTFSGANPVISASTTNTGLTVQANGTGTLALNSSGAGTVNVGTTNTTTVGIGNSTAATAVTIQGGTSSTAVSIVSGAGGTIRVGDNGVASTVQIGNTTGAVTQTVNIGTNPTASSQTNVTIGSTIGASATTIISGTGNLNLQTQGTGNLNVGANAVSQNIIIGNSTGGTNVSINCGTGTCALGTNAIDHSTTVGSTTGTSLTTIQSGTGGISLNGAVSTSGAINGVTLAASALTFSGANPVIGASTTNTGVTLQSNGTGTLTLNSSGAGTVNVGTTNTTTIGIGNSTAATAVTTTGGATVQTVANTGATIKTNTNSISALQVKDSSNNVVFNVDTTTGAVGTVSTSTASTASRALSLQSGAVSGTTSNSGDVTLQSGASSTSGNSGAVAIKTGDAGVGNSGSITLDVGTATLGSVGTIAIGGGNALSTTIGRSTGASAVTLQTGTGNLTLQTQGTGSILIGNNAVAQTIAIGNSTGATTVGINCGTGACGFGNNAVAHTTTVGSSTGNAATTVQSGTGDLNIQTQGTGNLNIGNNAVAQTINIGNATGATTVAVLCGTGTCGFGDNAVAHATTVGSATGSASTLIQSGTGNLSIQSQGTGTLGVGNNAVAQTIVIGNSTGGTSVAINCGTGDCTLGNNATDHSTTVGSGTGVSVTTIQGGTGGVVINSNTAINGTINTNTLSASALTFSGANPVISASTTNTGMTVQANGTGTLTLNSSGAGTVNVGTANTTTVGIGNNTAATTTTITGGTGANAVSIQTGTGGTISLGTTGIAGTIQIGTTTAVATQTIGIGNNATPSSVDNIAIGNLLTTSNTLIQGGTGSNAIQLNQGTGGTITIGGAGAASTVSVLCGAGTANTCGFANNATDHSTYLGSTNGVSATTIQSGTAGISLNGNVSTTGTLVTTGTINTNTLSASALTFSGASPIISTSSTNSGMTLQANGTGTLTLNTTGSGTVNIGTTNTTTVAAGNSGASTTVTLTGGATTTTVANAGTTVKTSTNSTTAFQVQNSAGAPILSVNTSTPQVAFTATAVNAVNGTPLVSTSYTNTSTTAGTETAQSISISDTGVVTSGTDTTNGINLSVTHTGQTGGTIATNGINLQVTMDNGGSATSTGTGVYSLVTGSADTATGIGGGFLAAGSANTTTATGVQGSVGSAFFTGTVTNAIGIGSSINATSGAGSFTNAYGIQVASSTVGGGGSIGANYGIQVQPQTVGTTNYGVAIGTASTQTLQVGYDADGTTANAGISFGATAGTAANLYRGGNNQLKTDSNFLVKSGTNAINALEVQNSSGTNIFAVDTISGTVGTVKTTTASTPSQALVLQSGTAAGTGSGTGNVTLQSGASTVSGTTGSLTLTTGAATSGSTGSITLDSGSATGGTAGSISIGTVNSRTIGVGNTTAATALTIQGGTGSSAIIMSQGAGGAITIGGSGAASTVAVLCGAGTSTNCGFANNATDHTTVVGSTTGTSATTVQGGTGGLTLTAGTINLNSATISTNQTTVSFMDTTATTVTALQSANSITMGATSGTLTLRNANIVLGNAAGSGSFTNNGGTTNITLPLGDFPTNAAIGTNSSTVDIYTSISINQSTTGRTLTIPTPSANITYGRLLYLSNIGTASFTLGSATISPGTTATLVWSNTTGGASWQFAGADAASILNQNSADQTANFRVSGTGRANTSFTAPLFDSITGGVSLGTSTASSVTIGNATTTTSVTANCGTGTCAFGSNATDHSTTIGSGTGVSATTINGGSAGIIAKSTSTTGFQVQNASGTSVLVVDTTNRQLKVMENGGSTNYALVYYDTATSTANYTASSGTVAVGTGAGAISIVAGTSSGITITSNAAALWRTTAGTLTLQSGTNSNLVLTPSGTGMATISGSAKLVLGQSAGDPGTCTVGALVYNTTSNTLRGCQGSTPTWNDVINVTTPTTQATYTASTGGTTPEIKLDTTRGAFDIQGDNAGAVTDLFDIRAGTASGLGTSLFNVASSGDTTIQSSAGVAELSTSGLDVTIGQGSTAHSTNPIVLVLDNYQPVTAGSNPTEQDGAMFYNADQNIFMCGNNGQWTNCAINQIQSSYVFEDEFLGGTTSAATGTSFQGVGALGWNVNATTSCAAAYNQTGPALAHDHPGTLRLTTAATSGNGCAMTQAGTAAGTATLSEIIGAGDVFKTNVAIGAQTGTMRIGWTNQTSNTAPTSGAWWEYNTTADATHLRYCYANNTTAVCAAGPVIAANTWAELEIYINSSSNITFVTNINGTPTSVTTTSAFDTGATNKLGPGATCYASTTTALNCYIDYIQWSGVNTATHGVRD